MHGDLHHENILQNGQDWILIDPKGVIGEPVFEIAPFVLNPIAELVDLATSESIVINRVVRFAEILALPRERIMDWCLVRAVLAWAWGLEDEDCNTECFARLAMLMEKCWVRF